MKSLLLSVLFGIVLCAIARAEIVVTKDSPDWTAIDVQAAQTRAKEAGGIVIDGSYSATFDLYGSISRFHASSVTPGFAVGVLEGHEKFVSDSGGRIISREKTKKFGLPGYVVKSASSGREKIVYLLFSNEDLYVIALTRTGNLAPEDTGLVSYLAQLKFPETGLVAGKIDAIDRDSTAYKLGHSIGYLAGAIVPICVLGAVGFVAWVVSKRKKKKEAKPGVTVQRLAGL